MARKSSKTRSTKKRAKTAKKRSKAVKKKATRKQDPALSFRNPDEAAKAVASDVHVYYRGAVCDTDTKGYATPENRHPTELVVDASEGFIPLWDTNVTLRWRFNEHSIQQFQDPEAAKGVIRSLLGEAILEWEDAVPIRFAERHDAWDFELAVRAENKCNPNGCTLASAFFPDSGRHDLVVYPLMFEQSHAEQVETLAHELGHVFGLRHFFADVAETAWPSKVFGKHSKFSIMNYGADSRLTNTDRSDLKSLYDQAWTGALADINGTPIKLMRPFSQFRPPVAQALRFASIPA